MSSIARIQNSGVLFPAIAESSATLTGLLFVAMSVAPRPTSTSHIGVVQQVRAAASLLAFTNPLAVSLFGLVYGTNVGYPATVLGVIGLFFTAAGMRSIAASTDDYRLVRRQLGLIVLLLLTFGFELGAGIALIAGFATHGSLNVVSNVLIASMLIGVARAWELVGDRDAGLLASIAVLSGHSPRHPGRLSAPDSETTASGGVDDGGGSEGQRA